MIKPFKPWGKLLGKPLRSRSIVSQLTIWYSFSTFIILAVSGFLLYRHLTENLKTESEHLLYDHIQIVHSVLKRKDDPLEALRRRVVSEWILRDFQKFYLIVEDVSGRVLLQSPHIPDGLNQIFHSNLPFQDQQDLIEKDIRTGANRYHSESGGKQEYYLVFVEEMKDILPEIGPMRIYNALDISHEEQMIQDYGRKLLLILGCAFLGALFIGWRHARKGLSSLTEIVKMVTQVRSSTLHERLNTEIKSREIQILAIHFNEMLNRLEEAFERLSLFSADIAHEIRTPVSSIVGTIEVTLSKRRTIQEYEEVLSSCLEEGMRISKIVESLLFVAKSENPETQIQKERIYLNKEIIQILEFYEVMAFEAGVKLEFHPTEDVSIPVERTLFQRAIGNLLSNAIEHTPPIGVVSVEVKEGVKPGFTSILVKDTGEGISKEHLAHVFDRFYRADQARTPKKNAGFGLGLTIVQGILRLHGGHLEIESEPGKGTTVILSFPKEAFGIKESVSDPVIAPAKSLSPKLNWKAVHSIQ